jgi:hypothetical protein
MKEACTCEVVGREKDKEYCIAGVWEMERHHGMIPNSIPMRIIVQSREMVKLVQPTLLPSHRSQVTDKGGGFLNQFCYFSISAAVLLRTSAFKAA